MSLKQLKRPRPTVATMQSVAAPIGGLNVFDAINLMPQTDAIDLVNWIPSQYGVRTRKGWREWGINLTGSVQTVMEYAPARSAATYKLFGVTDAGIYDVTVSTNAPAVSLALPGTTDCSRLSYTMLANSAGTFLCVASMSTGTYRYYDGTTWATPTFGVGAGQIGGVDPAKICYVQLWKRRLWFIERNTTNVWYLPVDSITGVAVKLDVGPLLENGGIVAFIARWTIDAGEGIDDFLVIGGENGDVLVYKGTDPASSSTFALVGVWYVGKMPVGGRACHQYGGDLLVLSVTGLQPISYVTRGGQSLLRASSVDYLKKIQPRFSDLLVATGAQNGWQIIHSLDEGLLVILTPNNATLTYEQYAMNTNTNRWCKFTGMSMVCAETTVMGSFFGTTDGKVCQFLTGYFDAVAYGATVGNGIAGIVQPAYSYYGRPGTTKQFQMIRPTFLAADRPSVTVAMVADYQQNIIAAAPVYTIASGSKWDTALWDAGIWAGGLTTYNDWYACGALGFAGSPYLVTVCVADTFLASIDVMFEPVQNGPQI